jgi:uncharacterized protein with ParB-like and HNH nuclease domain
MASGFQQPISIKEAIDNIFARQYLLPAIQRKFIWSSDQIEMLFDSIMRGYPINSFMFWDVKSKEIKSNFRFYEFIEEYREFFKVNNPDKDTTGVPDFKAVIDGQQRLTSLYIGLRGTYAYKMPRKWWYDTEENLPTRRLYLNLIKPLDQEHDNQKYYDFSFLSQNDLAWYETQTLDYHWFEVRKILDLDDLKKINNYLVANNLFEKDFSRDTLIDFYQRIHSDKLINFYMEDEQSPDKVLEVFIRTNSGGTPLSFSDLLMSIASANWEQMDARKEIERIINDVYLIGRPGFRINKDFILKTCLVLLIDNIKFQLKNFSHENVQLFETNWQRIRKSIYAGFSLSEKIGFNDVTLRAKNAVIPIIYYIYHKNLEDDIIKQAHHAIDRKIIQKWLNLTLIKSIFGGQSDNVLSAMRKEIRSHITEPYFPINEIIYAFKSNPTKNYSLDDDFIEGLLRTPFESTDSFYILSLLYPDLDYYNQDFNKDHMHPASFFYNEHYKTKVPQADWEFYRDPNNWNTILNLQLLNGSLNKSKHDKSLAEWVQLHQIDYNAQLIPKGIDLLESNFVEFISERKKLLIQKIKALV